MKHFGERSTRHTELLGLLFNLLCLCTYLLTIFYILALLCCHESCPGHLLVCFSSPFSLNLHYLWPLSINHSLFFLYFPLWSSFHLNLITPEVCTQQRSSTKQTNIPHSFTTCSSLGRYSIFFISLSLCLRHLCNLHLPFAVQSWWVWPRQVESHFFGLVHRNALSPWGLEMKWAAWSS